MRFLKKGSEIVEKGSDLLKKQRVWSNMMMRVEGYGR
jgi:hypothetical protein